MLIQQRQKKRENQGRERKVQRCMIYKNKGNQEKKDSKES